LKKLLFYQNTSFSCLWLSNFFQNMQIKSTFIGSVPGWTPAIQLQPVVQAGQTVHAIQMQPTQTQVMVVHPSKKVQYQLGMNQAGLSNQHIHTAQMTMAHRKSDKKVHYDEDWCRWNQEKVRLQQGYQILRSEYQRAINQIQTLTLQSRDLDRKLKMEQWKYQELNNKYKIDMEKEQNKYNALSKVHTKTCILLRHENDKCKALRGKLEESSKNLKKERQKYKVLSNIHSDTKQMLDLFRQKGEDVVNFTAVAVKNKFIANEKHDVAKTVLLKERQGESRLKPCLELVPAELSASHLSNHDPMRAAGEKSLSERSNHLVVPPGFEGSTLVSGQGTAEVH